MSLERRYRRLLRAYPAAWRAARGDELVGVLLDAAEAEGRTRPRPAEVADLVRGGVVARLQAGRRPALRVAWGEGAAVAACVAAVIFAARGAGYGLDVFQWLVLEPRSPSGLGDPTWSDLVLHAPVAWVAVIPIVLLWSARSIRREPGERAAPARALAVAVVGTTAADVLGAAWLVRTFGSGVGAQLVLWVSVEVAVACVLARPARARRGLAVLGPHLTGGLLVACLLAQWPRHTGWMHSYGYWLPAALALGVLWPRRRWVTGTTAGRRFLVAGAALTTAYSGAVGYRYDAPGSNWSPAALILTPVVVLAAAGTTFRLWPWYQRLRIDRPADPPAMT